MSEENAKPKFDKNSISNTFITATTVCLVCSFLVAGAAVALKPLQDQNKKRDIMSNIISVAGFQDRDLEAAAEPFDGKEKVGPIEACFKKGNGTRLGYIQDVLVDLETGSTEIGLEKARKFLAMAEDASDDEVIEAYDQTKAVISIDTDEEGNLLYAKKLGKDEDIASLKEIERVAHVYLLRNKEDEIVKYIFPVRGKGLWSVLYGFMAVEPDLQTISGLTYYSHGETPGLGGEVDNPSWKKQWTLNEDKPKKNKQIYGEDGKVKIAVIKGKASTPYQVDGLAGATITSNGVTYMLQFWLGDQGFGPYIENEKKQSGSSESVSANSGSKGAIDG